MMNYKFGINLTEYYYNNITKYFGFWINVKYLNLEIENKIITSDTYTKFRKSLMLNRKQYMINNSILNIKGKAE